MKKEDNKEIKPELIFNISKLDKNFKIMVLIKIGDRYFKIKNPDKLINYGQLINIDNYNYRITTDDIIKYSSIKSLNPEITENGDIIIDFLPSFIEYSLKNNNKFIIDKINSIKIEKEKIIPSFHCDYLKDKKSLRIEYGYSIESKEELIDIDEINKNKTKDGYLKIEDKFYKIIETKDEKIINKSEYIPLDSIPEFFKRDFLILKTKFKAVLTDEASKIEIHDEEITPRVEVDKKGIDWFEFKIYYPFEDKKINFDEALNLKGDYLILDDYKFIKINKDRVKNIKDELEKLDYSKDGDAYRVPIYEYLSIEEFVKDIGGEEIFTESYKKFLDEITDFKPDENFFLNEDLEIKLKQNGIDLRPYQRAGISWIYWLLKHNLHGILADDMGLGKTIQIIVGFYLLNKEEENEFKGNILIISPKSVVEFWKRELEKVIDKSEIFIYEYVGSNRVPNLLFNTSKQTIFLTTYETITKDIEQREIYKIPFYLIILDEATKIKNVNSLRTKSIKKLNSLHRFVVTGTPIENRPLELWSIFDFLMKGHLGSKSKFLEIEKEIVENNNQNYINLIIKKIKPFVLRRKKEDVAKDLPDKIILQQWCELTDEQKYYYNKIIEEKDKLLEINSFNLLKILEKLKQLCIHPALINNKKDPILGRSEKFDLAYELIMEIIEKNEKCIIFSEYLNPLNFFEELLISNSIKYIKITGAVQNRQELIDLFNNDNDYKVAILSLRATSHGITLTSANNAILLDLWWNPAVINQAIDRIHRIGQERTVYVHQILIKDTIEQKILDLLENKLSLSNKIMETVYLEGGGFTREELIEILKPI